MEPKSSHVVSIGSKWYWKPTDSGFIVGQVTNSGNGRVGYRLIRHDKCPETIGEMRSWGIEHFIETFKPIESEMVVEILKRYEEM